MMQKIIFSTALLLVVQLGLVLTMQLGGDEPQVNANVAFLSFAPEAVDHLTVIDGDKNRLVMAKSESGWYLPDYYQAPADDKQVHALLAKLAELKQGFVIARSAEAAARFKVATDSFERQVSLGRGEENLVTFFIGTSPAFRQVHARKEGSDNIITVALNSYDLATTAKGWLDKNVLKVDQDKIAEISINDATLRRQDDHWRFADTTSGEQLDQQKAGELVSKASGLTVQDVVDPEEGARRFAAGEVTTFTIKRGDGQELLFRLVKEDEGEAYLVHSTISDLYFQVHALPVDGLLAVSRESLLAGTGETPATIGAASEGPAE